MGEGDKRALWQYATKANTLSLIASCFFHHLTLLDEAALQHIPKCVVLSVKLPNSNWVVVILSPRFKTIFVKCILESVWRESALCDKCTAYDPLDSLLPIGCCYLVNSRLDKRRLSLVGQLEWSGMISRFLTATLFIAESSSCLRVWYYLTPHFYLLQRVSRLQDTPNCFILIQQVCIS